MKRLVIAIVTVAVALTVVPPLIYAEQFYVIRDRWGETAVTNGTPDYGQWSVESGPYATMDQAERATGTGMGNVWGTNIHRYINYPQVHRKSGKAPVVDITP